MRTALVPLLALLLLPTAAALVATSPSRFDLGEVDAGQTVTSHVRVVNTGSSPTRLQAGATVLEDERVEVEPASFSLQAGEARDVEVRVHLPANASGGRHDPRVELVEVPAEGVGTTLGRAAVSVPVVFWISNLKVGNLEVRHAPQGEDAGARVLVQNFLGEPVEADVAVLVLDAQGRTVARQEGRTAPIEANGSASLDLALPTAALPAGAYVVRAEASHAGRAGNAWSAPLFLGERRLALSAPLAEARPGGPVAFQARVWNNGTVAVSGSVSFLFAKAGAQARSVSAETGLLAPGESRLVRAEADLPPGEYAYRAVAYWSGGEAAVEGGALAVAGLPGDAETRATPLPPFGPVAGALVAALAARRRR